MADGNVSTGPKGSGGGGGVTGGGGTGSSGGGNSGGGGSDSGGGGSNNPMASYNAQQKKAQQAAADRAIADAERMLKQAAQLKKALGAKGMKAALDTYLKGLARVTRQQDNALVRDYRARVGSLKDASEDNVNSASAQTYANLSNAGRERANALSEVFAQGAGESDVLRAQGAALRNWNANQNEISRAFSDTNTSIDSALEDVTVDTRSARFGLQVEANADREAAWRSYYDRRSETLTQLSNIYGQAAAYYGSANEMDKSQSSQNLEQKYSKKSANILGNASTTSGKAWENPGVSKRIRKWEGAEEFTGSTNTDFGRPMAGVDLAKPEGATLRSW